MNQNSFQKYDQVPPSQDSNQKYIIIAALSFIVGFGLAWLIVANKENKKAVINDGADTSGQTILDEEINNDVIVPIGTTSILNVTDQLAGDEVIIDSVSLDKPSWVVIHEKNSEGVLVRILGAQLFGSGIWTGKVELLRGTVAGNEYVAAIHLDNGDRVFDSKKDLQRVGSDGNLTQKVFKAHSNTQNIDL